VDAILSEACFSSSDFRLFWIHRISTKDREAVRFLRVKNQSVYRLLLFL